MISNKSLWRFDENENQLIFYTGEDILTDYKNLFSQLFPNLSLEPNTPQMQLIAFLAETDAVTIKEFAKLVNYFFNGGSGEMLDLWAWNMFRAQRKKAVLGYATIKIQGVAGTQIPKGYKVSDGEQIFQTDTASEIGANGEVEVIVTALEVSEKTALTGAINLQITPILGVERVTNEAPSVAGIAQETDSAFYRRCITYNSLYKNSSFRSIMANVAQIQGVTKINGYENPTSGEVVFKGETFQPHSFGVVCIGGDDTEIAEVIRKCKSIGSYAQGNIEVNFTDPVYQTISTYRFYRATNAPLKFSVKARLYKQSPNAYEQIIKDGLKLFVDNLQIGDYFTQPQVSQFLANYINGFDIVDLKIAFKNGDLGYSPVIMTFLQNATIAEGDISITYELAENEIQRV